MDFLGDSQFLFELIQIPISPESFISYPFLYITGDKK